VKNIQHSRPLTDDVDVIAAASIVDSDLHATGHMTKHFEDDVSELLETKYAKATNTGTAALHLALLAIGVTKDDEVILPSYVCQSVLNAINYIGATPVLADLDSNFQIDGYHISEKTIKPLITNKTKAIIVPHMFGYAADINGIIPLGLPIVEDCAQSLGTKRNGKTIGSLGTLGVLSFFATKTISTGYGGMVVTSSKKIKESLDDLTKYDKRDTYKVSYNYGLTDIQAALGMTQLNKLPDFLGRRKKIGEQYDEAFKNLNINLPPKIEGSIPFRYVISLKNQDERNNLQLKLRDNGVICERPVFRPLHQYLSLSYEKFPNTEKAHSTALSIPIYPALTDEDVERIISNIIDNL
jgi:perosamine synthetase